jgi:hypothetical protein
VAVISSQISGGTVESLTRARKWQLKKGCLMVATRWVMLLLLSDAGGRRRGRERRDKGEEAGCAGAACG